MTQTRIDARNLGYAPMDVIPDDESGITSLSVSPDGQLYGATSGSRSHLFVLNPRHGYVQPLGIIPHATSIANAVAISASDDVYIGTAPDGHLLKYSPLEADTRQIQIEKPLAVADLGQAIGGESITRPGHRSKRQCPVRAYDAQCALFSYSIADAKFHDLGVVAERIPFGEKFEKSKIMSRMLVVDQAGMIFTSGQDGAFFRFDPKIRKLEKLGDHAPAEPGREAWTRVDAFLLDPSGAIYGGTSDGYLFRLDPIKLTVTNLGKPLSQYGIAGLVRSPNGLLYGVGGTEKEMARLFSYDPSTGAYNVLGFIDVNRRPYYTWQAYVIGALASGLDGTVYIGENERVSKLYLFYP